MKPANMARLLGDLFTPDLDTIHLADGENFADEIAHAPFPCVAENCQALPCVDLRRALLERNILLAHPFGFMVPQ